MRYLVYSDSVFGQHKTAKVYDEENIIFAINKWMEEFGGVFTSLEAIELPSQDKVLFETVQYYNLVHPNPQIEEWWKYQII